MKQMSIFDESNDKSLPQVTKYEIGNVVASCDAPRDVGNEIYWDELGQYADQLVVIWLPGCNQWRVVRLGIVIGDKVSFYLLRTGARSHLTRNQMTRTKDRFFFCRLRG